ncbi:hypothetical protein Ocin01_15712 [Orchesella cincta]|uniref:EB domain-containing protein n=1 Tax=Orchesella cincta TaxID=48709 RepID=A0A1D2MDI1_ORCCI|nr:hypothetical protein Ocin01_15712 [Orchesella cincta]
MILDWISLGNERRPTVAVEYLPYLKRVKPNPINGLIMKYLLSITSILIVLLHQAWSDAPQPVEVGEFCDLESGPTGPNGSSWGVIEGAQEKQCPPGTTCRTGACNCDDLSDGSVTGISQDSNGNRVCRKVAGQKCSSDGECFQDVKCISNICTCPKDVHCQSKKNDVYILD